MFLPRLHHEIEQSLAVYRALALSDVAQEYEMAMRAFPNSFIGKGSIWPEPDVEMSMLAFTPLPLPSYPACRNSSLACAGLYS
jgi:hypothetical protein